MGSNYQIDAVAGTDVNVSIGFYPQAAIVSNYTPFYLYLPDGQVFVSPWTLGAVVPLLHAVQGKATWGTSPFGVAQVITPPPAGQVYKAALIFTDNALVASGGTAIQVAIGGTVNISGTANVTIVGTPNVNVTGTPNVNVANTPAVTVSGGVNVANITAGTVDVQNVTNGILTAAGNLVYVGSINSQLVTYAGVAGHGQLPVVNASTITVTLTALERAIVVAVPNQAAISNGAKWRVVVATHNGTPAAVQTRFVSGLGELAVFYVNPLIDTQWDVWIGDDAGTYIGYIFTDTALPIMDIARSGQQAMAQSIPVAIANDQSPSADGQVSAAQSIQVYDDSAGRYDRLRGNANHGMRVGKAPYINNGRVNPGVGALATVTIAGIAGYRWVVDLADFSLTNNGVVAAGVTAVILDGATTIWGLQMQCPAVAGGIDRLVAHDMALTCSVGNSVTIGFAVGLANIFESLSYGLYLW